MSAAGPTRIELPKSPIKGHRPRRRAQQRTPIYSFVELGFRNPDPNPKPEDVGDIARLDLNVLTAPLWRYGT
jgi:hypothetical protein